MYTLIVERKSGKTAFPVNTCDLPSALEEFAKAEAENYSKITGCKYFSLPPIISLELVKNFMKVD